MPRPLWILCLAGALAVVQLRLAGATPVTAGTLRLGDVTFATSGHPDAQPHFRRGVAALHSFWYPEALAAFQVALQLDPAFDMAWWGVAMCYYRPYLAGSNDDAGRRALAQIRDTSRLTLRERTYIEALRTFYAEGPPDARTVAYAQAMEKLYLAYPDDLEAAAFYALSLLGYRWSTEEGSARQERAGTIAQGVFERNPLHPGASHYIIHSYDEPLLAERALAAATHYATIAPDAPHALHMPSHIFLQLGMWPAVIANNEAAWSASEAWVQRRGLNLANRDYHNYHWLIYGCLQEGRYTKAAELLARFREMRPDLPPSGIHYLDDSVGAYLIETRNWGQADELLALLTPTPGRDSVSGAAELCREGPADLNRRSGADVVSYLAAYVSAITGKPGAGPARDQMKIAASKDDVTGKFWRVRHLMVTALAAAREKSYEAAVASAREAATLDDELGRSPGPPPSFKPPHELSGELLLAAGRPAEAMTNFEKSLVRHPNRPLSILGRARAAAAAKRQSAASESYRHLLLTWQNADPSRPELAEARAYIEKLGN